MLMENSMNSSVADKKRDKIIKLKTYCVYCQNFIKDIVVICQECNDITLCIECLYLGAEIGNHKFDHEYKYENIMPLMPTKLNWAVDEDIKLVEAIDRHGFGNWDAISPYMYKRSPQEIEKHFEESFIDSNFGKVIFNNYHEDKNKNTDAIQKQILPSTLIRSKEASLLGYSELRDDFEREYCNEAENIMKDLHYELTDNDIEISCKYALYDHYCRILRERHKRKEFVKQYGMISTYFVSSDFKNKARSLGIDPVKLVNTGDQTRSCITDGNTCCQGNQFSFGLKLQQNVPGSNMRMLKRRMKYKHGYLSKYNYRNKGHPGLRRNPSNGKFIGNRKIRKKTRNKPLVCVNGHSNSGMSSTGNLNGVPETFKKLRTTLNSLSASVSAPPQLSIFDNISRRKSTGARHHFQPTNKIKSTFKPKMYVKSIGNVARKERNLLMPQLVRTSSSISKPITSVPSKPKVFLDSDGAQLSQEEAPKRILRSSICLNENSNSSGFSNTNLSLPSQKGVTQASMPEQTLNRVEVKKEFFDENSSNVAIAPSLPSVKAEFSSTISLDASSPKTFYGTQVDSMAGTMKNLGLRDTNGRCVVDFNGKIKWENELPQLIKPFARFVGKQDFVQMCTDLVEIKNIQKRIADLKECQLLGIDTLEEADMRLNNKTLGSAEKIKMTTNIKLENVNFDENSVPMVNGFDYPQKNLTDAEIKLCDELAIKENRYLNLKALIIKLDKENAKHSCEKPLLIPGFEIWKKERIVHFLHQQGTIMTIPKF